MPPVNLGLAQLSDHFLLATVFFYALAVLAFAGDFAFGRRAAPRVAEKQTDAGVVAERAPVAVGAGVAAQTADAPAHVTEAGETAETAETVVRAKAAAGADAGADGGPGVVAASRWRASGAPAGPWVRAALALTVLGLITQILGIATRGMAEHRVPWGNMYEFVMAITCAAVIAFLLLLIRFRVYSVGLFLMAPIVLALGLCATVLYTAAGPLVPALHSYWIWIHVTTMTVAIGSYIVAAVLTVLYLIADRRMRRNAADPQAGFGAVLHRLPPADALDRLSYRTVIFAFPIWTFAVIAGAIWADQAWEIGRASCRERV